MLTDFEVEAIASVCYEANRQYCRTLGDDSFKPWDEAEEWQRNTNKVGVRFRYDNRDAGPEHMHESWMKLKVQEGWVYGDVKDSEKKTHPCMVPYDKLPVFQRRKDYLFTAIFEAMITKIS